MSDAALKAAPRGGLLYGLNRDVWLLAAAQALCNTSTAIVISASALVGAMLAEDKSLATFPHAMTWLSTMASSAMVSMLMRGAGRRFGFVVGAAAGLIGAFGIAWSIYAGSFQGFVAASIVMGFFNAAGMLYRFAAAEVAAPEVRAKAISLVIGGGIVSAILGPEIAKHTVDAFAPFRFMGTYIALAAVPLLLAMVIMFIRFPPQMLKRAAGPTGRPLGQIMAQRNFVVAVLAGMIGWGGMVLVMTATPLSMVACGHSFADSAFVIQWHIVGMFAPSFFTGSLIVRYGLARVMLAGVVLMALAVIAGVTGVAVTNFLLVNVLAGVGWNFLFVGSTTLLAESHTPAERAKVQGFNDAAVFMTLVVSSLSSGALFTYQGWMTMNLFAIPALGLAAASLLWLAMVRRPAAAA